MRKLWFAVVALAALLTSGCGAHLERSGAADAPTQPIRTRVVDLHLEPAPEGEPVAARVTLGAAALLDGSGWTVASVRTAIDAARTLLRERCAIRIAVPRVVVVAAPHAYRRLDAGAEVRLLARLREWHPRLWFVDATTDNDVAYSYLSTSPVAQAGSAWFTRNVLGPCAGQLIAHEIGHLAFNSTAHDSDPDNFMHPGCRASNLQGRSALRIEPRQCARFATGLKLLEGVPGHTP